MVAAISRLDSKSLGALVGLDAFKHLKAKNLGGTNNYKGGRYEEFFGAHRIARLAKKLITRHEDATVEWQSDCFVDDFVVRRDSEASFTGYQLKNAAAVSWTLGTIANDFKLQHSVSTAEGYADVRLRLVCSHQSVVSALKTSVPNEIAGFSRPMYFPYDEQLMKVLWAHSWMVDDFGFLSKHEHPTKADAQQVASVMMGAWSASAPKANVSDILNQARDMSPTIMRSVQSDEEARSRLLPEFVSALQAMPDFTYDIMKGFMRWSAMSGSTTGVLSFDCFHEKFVKLQRHIAGLSPKSFQDIEGVLI